MTPGPPAARIAEGLLDVPGVSRIYPGSAAAALRNLTGAEDAGGRAVSVTEHDGTTEVLASIGTDGGSPAVDVALQAVDAARKALGPGTHRVTIRIASVG